MCIIAFLWEEKNFIKDLFVLWLKARKAINIISMLKLWISSFGLPWLLLFNLLFYLGCQFQLPHYNASLKVRMENEQPVDPQRELEILESDLKLTPNLVSKY